MVMRIDAKLACFYFFFSCSGHHRDLHSFPTRRSSDLWFANPSIILSPETKFFLAHAVQGEDRKSTRLNSSHGYISYAVFCLKKKKKLLREACPPHAELELKAWPVGRPAFVSPGDPVIR